MDAAGDGLSETQIEIIKYAGHELPKEYWNYILGKWKRSLRHGNDYFRLIDNKAYNDAYDMLIMMILARPGAVVRLAVLSDNRDIALGWSLIQGDILHYVFVQAEYRGMGLAKKLIPQSINTVTHLTKTGMNIWNAKAPHVKFNPFA